MSFAIYRKYRPSTFEDLSGQDLIVHILKESAKENKLGHAYLFSGPRGTGKTSTARLLSKIANCKKRTEDTKFKSKGEPCNACEACAAIDEGRSLDVIEIDAASNRGIDEIRNLKESIRLSPSSLRYKVFIIDEAHMLTKDAWNALLKTLEEPPTYIIIILATTEIEKVPATISSRAQQFHFKRVSREDIVKKLSYIAKAEKIDTSKEALDLIASAAEGSFRDAESLLEQFIAFSDKKITVEEVEKAIGKVNFNTLSDFCGLLLTKDLPKALESLAKINDGGYNLAHVTKDLIQYLRRVAVLKYNPQMKDLFGRELMEEHVSKIFEHSKLFTDAHITLLKNLIQAYSQMRYSQFPLIPLEIALIESLR